MVSTGIYHHPQCLHLWDIEFKRLILISQPPFSSFTRLLISFAFHLHTIFISSTPLLHPSTPLIASLCCLDHMLQHFHHLPLSTGSSICQKTLPSRLVALTCMDWHLYRFKVSLCDVNWVSVFLEIILRFPNQFLLLFSTVVMSSLLYFPKSMILPPCLSPISHLTEKTKVTRKKSLITSCYEN